MKRSKHSLSHYHLTSMNQGALVPISMFEVLPGDTVQMSTSALVRMSPLVSPVMHPVHARIHHWYVPYRLIWNEFENFITGGPDGLNASVAPFIQLNTRNVLAGSLLNYFGVPINNYTTAVNISALPLRAYALIFNENYRDQDLVSAIPMSVSSGADGTTNLTLQNVAWEKDYFTAARPFEQKGATASVAISTVPSTAGQIRLQATNLAGSGALTGAAGTGVFQVAGANAYYDPAGSMAIDVNDLRESLAIQRYREARARFGSRYTEYLRYLGVKSSDARLNRPEYLGGGKQTVQFSEVLQTAEGTNPVGMMRGHGIGAMRSNRWRRFFEEHGVVISLMSTVPRTVYMQAMNRSWFRTTKEMYWQKELEHIGQQTITQKEVYAPGPLPNDIFGYQDRYDEYRRQESRVSGEFASTLKYWHMARDLGAAPALNASFVQANPTNRVYASTTSDQMYVMAMHSIQARRMVSKVGSSFIF